MQDKACVRWTTLVMAMLLFSSVTAFGDEPVSLWREVSIGVMERQVGEHTERVYSGADGARAAIPEVQAMVDELWLAYREEPTDKNWGMLQDQERVLHNLENAAATSGDPVQGVQDCAHWGVLYEGEYAAPLPFPQCGLSAGTAFLFEPQTIGSIVCGDCEVYARVTITHACGDTIRTKRAVDGWKSANGPLATYANAQTTLTYPGFSGCRTDHVAQAECESPTYSYHTVIWTAHAPSCGSGACALCANPHQNPPGGPCLPGRC